MPAAYIKFWSVIALVFGVWAVLVLLLLYTGPRMGKLSSRYAGVNVATVTLTNDQIKALPTTAVELLPAPPTGFWNHVLSATVVKRASAGAYTNIDADAKLTIEYDNWNQATVGIVNSTASTPVLAGLTNFFSADDQLMHLPEYTEGTAAGVTLAMGNEYGLPGGSDYLTSFEAVAVKLTLDNNGSGDLTGGHADNSLRVTLIYVVEPL